MKNSIGAILLLAMITLAGCSETPAPTSSNGSSQASPAMSKTPAAAVVPNAYIVVLSSELQKNPVDAQMRLDVVLRDLSLRYELSVTQKYTSCLLGFAATMTPGIAAAIQKDPRIEVVEQDHYAEAYAQTIPSGVTRIGGQNSSTHSGNGSGTVTGVDIYIIDTGIQTNHPDLNVVGGVNCVRTGQNTYNDLNGHGTHCAGIAAAKDNTSYVVGVAPGANLYAVRVLDQNGSGQYSWILAGVDWVTARKNANPSRPMVASMSLGGNAGNSQYNSMDNGVKNSISAGVTYTIAAGNSSADAINFSPAHVTEAITVGAYNSTGNVWASFSNFGSVVDILAPGVNILSTYKGTTTATLSGTSMSTPHVAGTAALYLTTHTSASPATVLSDLLYAATHASNGTNATISSVPSGTTNISLWVANF